MKYIVENVTTGDKRSFSASTVGKIACVADEFSEDIASIDGDSTYHIYVGTKFKDLVACR